MRRSQFWAYGSLGLLAGFLVGLSGGDVAKALLAGIFAFSGGSAIAVSAKLDERGRQWTATAIMAVSVFAIVGIVVGILVTQHRLLGGERQVATLDALITTVASEELERRKQQGSPIEISELVALLKAKQGLDPSPFYISSPGSGGSPLRSTVTRALEQYAKNFLSAEEALAEIQKAVRPEEGS